MALTRKTPLKRTPFKRKPKEDTLKSSDTPKKKVTRKKKPEKRKLIEKLDTVFSQYIRLKEASPKSGLVRCISCGAVHHWTKIQNGHYESRANMATRWSESNCHPQCVACNVMQHGNMLAYRRAMVKKYGENKVNQIEAFAHTTKKWSEWELEEMIKYYTVLVKQLKAEKGL